MTEVRGPWEVLCATVLLLVACGGDDPANPIDDGVPPSQSLAECTPEGTTAGWSFTRLGLGAKPALALGTDGTVHAAFMNEATDGWVRYARLAVGADEPSAPESVDAGYFYGPIDIVVGSDDQPWVLFHDHSREDQVLALRAASGSWSLRPMSNSGHDGWYNAGVLDAAGTLHTATYDPRGFDGQGVTYGAWDGLSWRIELAAPGSFGYAGGMAIALTADGRAHIAFFDDVAGEARIASRSGDGTWDVTTIEALGGGLETGRFPDLAVGSDGETLHLVYFARSSATQGGGPVRHGRAGRLPDHRPRRGVGLLHRNERRAGHRDSGSGLEREAGHRRPGPITATRASSRGQWHRDPGGLPGGHRCGLQAADRRRHRRSGPSARGLVAVWGSPGDGLPRRERLSQSPRHGRTAAQTGSLRRRT